MKNIYKNLTANQQHASAVMLSKERNEAWYVLGNSGMVANEKGRMPHSTRNWKQYEALEYVNGEATRIIPAMTGYAN